MRDSDSRWVWYGGRPSLDFVNTRRDRQEGGVEYLLEPRDLSDWLRASGALSGRAAVDHVLLTDAVELREAIDAGIRAAISGAAAPPVALGLLNRWLAGASAQPARLRNVAGVTILDIGPGDARQALARIAIDAATLLGTDNRGHLRICPGPGCGGRFLDDSPAGRRRWCSMAVCGNRHKAANHRQTNRA